MISQIQNAWPGWQVERIIGKGSFGQVYEISRNLYGSVERSALKVIGLPPSNEDIRALLQKGRTPEQLAAYYSSCREEILREYSLMAEVKGHSNIVYCDDFRQVLRPDRIGWDIHIKMELLTSLFHVMPHFYDEALVIQLGRNIAAALALCERKGIIHRDIKPENVFYSPTGDFRLGDFGVAKLLQQVERGDAIGTYDYMAPEVYNGQFYGSSADLYSLGILLYWAMNDRHIPFLPESAEPITAAQKEAAWKLRMTGQPIPPPKHGSPQLVEIVMTAIQYDPTRRYPSAAHMQQALARLKASVFVPNAGSHFHPASDL